MLCYFVKITCDGVAILCYFKRNNMLCCCYSVLCWTTSHVVVLLCCVILNDTSWYLGDITWYVGEIPCYVCTSSRCASLVLHYRRNRFTCYHFCPSYATQSVVASCSTGRTRGAGLHLLWCNTQPYRHTNVVCCVVTYSTHSVLILAHIARYQNCASHHSHTRWHYGGAVRSTGYKHRCFCSVLNTYEFDVITFISAMYFINHPHSCLRATEVGTTCASR